MASPTNVIADAFRKLNRSISAEDAHKFASTDLEDVWKAVQDIQNLQRKRQSVQNLRRIEPLLKGLEKYSKVIEVLCNGTPFMPYAWAPIKLMLQLASNHRDIFDALLDAYAAIGAALPRFDRYEKVFRENREFQNVLAAVYSGILEFHERTYKFFKRRAWSIIFLSLWKDFQSRFANIIETLKKQRDFVDAEAASIDMVESAESRSRLQLDIEQRQKASIEALERNEKNDRTGRLRSSVEWLAVDDIAQETEYERMARRRHDGTCEWISSLPQVKNWLRNDTRHSLLWLSGKPGAGKSVMCSHIIHFLNKLPDLNVCYYFCNSLSAGTVCSQILKTVALQLLRRHPDLASLIANEYVDRFLNCSMTQLRVLIPQILELVSHTRIIIDGLDECSMADQKEVLRELQPLCLHTSIRCKILISSRREVLIREKLSSNQHIPLEEREEVQSDIRLYVKYKMMKLCTPNADLRKEIESVLVEKANGMFLWVRLVIDELRHCYSDADLKERALGLPKGLEKAYGRILDRILDEQPFSYATSIAVRILEWMSCSFRPLKYYEILDGISFRLPENSGTTYRPACTTLDRATQIQRDVLDLCKPLIEDGPGNTIDFVHFSAKEYILKQEYRSARPFIRTENAHLNISFSCVSYLNTSLCLLSSNCTDQQRTSMVLHGFHGLQFYASQFWFNHILACCGLLAKRNVVIPDDLITQLENLLKSRKKTRAKSSESGYQGAFSPHQHREDYLALNRLPRNVKDFIREVIEFRKKLKKEDAALKSPEVISREACSTDPTYLSEIRHLYQHTLEELLNSNTGQEFPLISQNQLRHFQQTFGPSAFTCRYTHCSRAVEGFDSAKRRNDHEAAHQRKYRCENISCISYTTGFATKSALKRHNDKYHPAAVKETSLSTGIVLALRQVRKSPAIQNLRRGMISGEGQRASGQQPTQRRVQRLPLLMPGQMRNLSDAFPPETKQQWEDGPTPQIERAERNSSVTDFSNTPQGELRPSIRAAEARVANVNAASLIQVDRAMPDHYMTGTVNANDNKARIEKDKSTKLAEDQRIEYIFPDFPLDSHLASTNVESGAGIDTNLHNNDFFDGLSKSTNKRYEAMVHRSSNPGLSYATKEAFPPLPLPPEQWVPWPSAVGERLDDTDHQLGNDFWQFSDNDAGDTFRPQYQYPGNSRVLAEPPGSGWYAGDDDPWVPTGAIPNLRDDERIMRECPINSERSMSREDPLFTWYAGKDSPWFRSTIQEHALQSATRQISNYDVSGDSARDTLMSWYTGDDGPWIPEGTTPEPSGLTDAPHASIENGSTSRIQQQQKSEEQYQILGSLQQKLMMQRQQEQFIMTQLQLENRLFTDWRANVGNGERCSRVWHILLLLLGHVSDTKLRMALATEKHNFYLSFNKVTYFKWHQDVVDQLIAAKNEIGPKAEINPLAEAFRRLKIMELNECDEVLITRHQKLCVWGELNHQDYYTVALRTIAAARNSELLRAYLRTQTQDYTADQIGTQLQPQIRNTITAEQARTWGQWRGM